MNSSARGYKEEIGYPFIRIIDHRNPVDPRCRPPECWRKVTVIVSPTGTPTIVGHPKHVEECAQWELGQFVRFFLGEDDSQTDPPLVIVRGDR